MRGLGYQGKELRFYSPPPFLFHYLQSRCPGPVKEGGREGRQIALPSFKSSLPVLFVCCIRSHGISTLDISLAGAYAV